MGREGFSLLPADRNSLPVAGRSTFFGITKQLSTVVVGLSRTGEFRLYRAKDIIIIYGRWGDYRRITETAAREKSRRGLGIQYRVRKQSLGYGIGLTGAFGRRV